MKARFVCPTILSWGLAIALAMVCASPSISTAAAPLPPGGSLNRPGTSPALLPPYYTAGPVPSNYSQLVVSTPFPYLYTGAPDAAFYGAITSVVWRDPSTGDLAFAYSLNNDAPPGPTPPVTDIVRATLDDPSHPWQGVSILDAGADGLGTSTPQGSPSWSDGDPYDLERDSLFSGLDMQLRVASNGTYLLSSANDNSATFWFATDATHYGITNVGLSDGGDIGTAQAYAPAVPEPTSLLLLTIGCCGLIAARKGLARTRRDAP